MRGAPDDWLGGKFRDKAGWTVVRIEENRALVLRDEIERGSWSFVLNPVEEGKTRLIIRARGRRPDTLGKKIFHYGFMEPAHFIMERKMLLTLKERAEEYAADHTDETELDLTAEKISA